MLALYNDRSSVLEDSGPNYIHFQNYQNGGTQQGYTVKGMQIHYLVYDCKKNDVQDEPQKAELFGFENGLIKIGVNSVPSTRYQKSLKTKTQSQSGFFCE